MRCVVFLIFLLNVVVPEYIFRAGKKGSLMLDEFGDEYRQYMKTTGRIIPKKND